MKYGLFAEFYENSSDEKPLYTVFMGFRKLHDGELVEKDNASQQDLEALTKPEYDNEMINFQTNYREPYNNFDLLSYGWKEAVSKKVIAESNIVNINKNLSKGLSQAWYPFDVGNFHKNYYNAIKQNKRILSTFSTYVNIESQFFMNYRLGQIVNFMHMDSQDISNSIHLTSGKYIIKAININMTPSKITSSLKLAMQGLNGTAVTQEVY